MSQMNELKREIQEAKKLHLSWRTRLFIFIIGAPTVFLFAVYCDSISTAPVSPV